MASILVKLWSKLSQKKSSFSIMIVGLDNSGKTSILNYLMSSSSSSSSSTSSNSKPNEQHQKKKNKPDSCRQISSIEADLTDFNDNNFAKSLQSEMNAEPDFVSLLGRDSVRTMAENEKKANSSNVNPTIGYNYEQINLKGLTITVLDFSGQNKYRSLWQEFYSSVDGIVFVIDSSDLIRFVVARDELECMLSHPYFTTMIDCGEHLTPDESEPGRMTRRSISLIKGLSASTAMIAPKRIIISQGKLIQSPLDTVPLTTASSCSRNTAPNLTQQQPTFQRQQGQVKRTKVPILFLANKTDLANSADIEVIVKALNLNQLPSNRHPWLIKATNINSGQEIKEGFDWLASQLVSITR